MRSYAIKRRTRIGKSKWITVLYSNGYSVAWKISKTNKAAVEKGEKWVNEEISGNGNPIENQKV
jgi:seryl-tRNA(Sec) selenium transferase